MNKPNQFQLSFLLKYYQCENLSQLIETMSHCLELEVTESDFYLHLQDFKECYPRWIDSHKEF